MDKIYLSLVMDLTDEAPDGAGWYVQMFQDITPVAKSILVPNEAALEVASSLYKALEASNEELPPIGPESLVISGNKLIFNALQKQLKFAEEQASKIGILRQRINASKEKELN